jgi:branched-subunit amino acid aminotransferase/4-amino-4-deoxychorismate lyase
MIWVRGAMLPDQALRVSALDRVFEHGLGLFETFRTWNGHPTLVSRHFARMERSARELEIAFCSQHLPDRRAIRELVIANVTSPGLGEDARVRLTLTGGLATTPPSDSVLWMTAVPLAPPLRKSGAVITRVFEVPADDPLARHKTLNYWRRRIAHETALQADSDEILCATSDGLVCEGSRSNIFIVEGGRLITPGLDGPLVPGVMRRLVLDRAPQLGLEVEEGPLPPERAMSASEAFLTNSVAGVMPIARLLDARLPAPGPVTDRLWNDLLPWLQRGGVDQ